MVNKDEVNLNPVACPNCNNTETLIVKGYLLTPREETFEDGQIIHVECPLEKTVFDVKQIYCLECQVQSIIQDPINYVLQRNNLELNARIIDLTDGKEDYLNQGRTN